MSLESNLNNAEQLNLKEGLADIDQVGSKEAYDASKDFEGNIPGSGNEESPDDDNEKEIEARMAEKNRSNIDQRIAGYLSQPVKGKEAENDAIIFNKEGILDQEAINLRSAIKSQNKKYPIDRIIGEKIDEYNDSFKKLLEKGIAGELDKHNEDFKGIWKQELYNVPGSAADRFTRYFNYSVLGKNNIPLITSGSGTQDEEEVLSHITDSQEKKRGVVAIGDGNGGFMWYKVPSPRMDYLMNKRFGKEGENSMGKKAYEIADGVFNYLKESYPLDIDAIVREAKLAIVKDELAKEKS